MQETGVHLCQFWLDQCRGKDRKLHVNESFVDRKQLTEQVEHQAIMLSYRKANQQFQRQYTLVYSDWDVYFALEKRLKGFRKLGHVCLPMNTSNC